MKKLMLYSLLAITVLLLVGAVFLTTHAPFGGTPDREQREAFERFDNYQDGAFVNEATTDTNLSFSEGLSMIWESAFPDDTEREPSGDLPVKDIDWDVVRSQEDSLTWFGHSTFLLSVDGRKLFVDPMLGNRASPVSFVGGSERYSEDWLDIVEELPPIDAVFLTHDHYDHLDYASIIALKEKVGHFFVPLGVSVHLMEWGVERERITELNWWDELQFEGLTVALTPANHFSGRGPFNRNSTLWGGWVILGQELRFYTSGDGGYYG